MHYGHSGFQVIPSGLRVTRCHRCVFALPPHPIPAPAKCPAHRASAVDVYFLEEQRRTALGQARREREEIADLTRGARGRGATGTAEAREHQRSLCHRAETWQETAELSDPPRWKQEAEILIRKRRVTRHSRGTSLAPDRSPGGFCLTFGENLLPLRKLIQI